MNKGTISTGRTWILLSILISITITLGGFLYYSVEKNKIRLEKYDEIASVAQLKAGQIQSWRSERIEDVEIISKSRLYVDAILNLLNSPSDERLRKTVNDRLALEKNPTFYSDAFILDTTGRRLISIKTSSFVDPSEDNSFREVVLKGEPVMSDLFRGVNGKVHVDAMAPIIDKAHKVAAVVVLQSDADNFLYPLIDSWPIPSRSAETLLLERRNDSIVFLTKLRYSLNSAFSLRMPLTLKTLPAVQAALGGTGMFEGEDYRGVRVLADLRPVQNTPWFMISKVDEDEILSEAYYRGEVVILSVVLFLGISVTATAYTYRRRQAGIYREMYHAELERKEIEEEFKATLYSIGDGVITTDINGLVRHMNPVAESLTGWTEHEANSKPLDDIFRIVSEETRSSIKFPVDRILTEGRVIGLANHTLLVSRDGIERPIADSGAALRDESGNVNGVVLIFRDQTKEREAERKLRESEENYREIFNSTGDAIFIDDASSGRMVDVNNAVLKMYGYAAKEEILACNIGDLSANMEPYTEEAAQQFIKRSIIEGPQRFEWLARRKDDSKFWIEMTLRKTEIGGKNRILAVGRDITERKNAEIALRESEEKFRGLVEGSSAAIWIHDSTRFLYGNPAALTMTGYTADELYRLAPVDIIHPDWRDLVMKRAAGRLSGKKLPNHYEYQILKKNGEALWIDFSAAVIEYDEKAAIIASAYDITERKRLEEQLLQSQKMEGIGRLAGGVAHDYNNMLGVIIGYSEMLLSKMYKADPAYRSVEYIRSAAKRGADITKQLLAFARREIVSPRVINPDDEIESLDKMFESLIGENIKLSFLPGDNVWNIKVDKTQFDQILVNLATNARDAIENDGTITIETSNVSIDEAYTQNRIEFSPGEYVMITFTDSGKGMSEETMDKIFEPFFTTKPKGQGTGLGLSTIYGIVKQNGGSINVYSELGVGTTFKIYLPRYQGNVERVEEVREETAIDGTGTILAVEDQPDLLELVKKSLEEFGYKVLTAVNPEEGIRLSEEHRGEIDLLLTDVIMPVMNGKELRNRIQAVRPRIKTIFMSGYTANVIAHEGVLDEGVDFIQKPFTPRSLAQKVQEILKA